MRMQSACHADVLCIVSSLLQQLVRKSSAHLLHMLDAAKPSAAELVGDGCCC
jgi:hypothetical protein